MNDATLDESVASLPAFKSSLYFHAHETVNDVDKSNQVGVLRTILAQKKDQMATFQKQKITLMGEVNSDQDGLQELDELYYSN